MTSHRGGSSGPITIDLMFLDQPGVVAAYMLRSLGDVALIEIGPASTAETLLSSLAKAGVAPEEVRHLLVTHIHLDHAGAAGVLASRLPNARVYVHEIGAPHLIDPTKLVNSATRIYGGLMKRLWGTIIPVPADRVVLLHDSQVLDVGGRRIQVLYSPGHAIHHVVFHDLDDGSIFAGDMAGARLQGCGYVRPTTPPPDLDLEAWEMSLGRLIALDPTAVYLTHFGGFTDVRAHLQQLRARLRVCESLVLKEMELGSDHTGISMALQRAGDEELARAVDPGTISKYETASSYSMNASGYERYIRKRHPELAVPASSL